jgi:hypothetical protein
VNSFLAKINFKIYENGILTKSCTLLILRNIHEEDGTTKTWRRSKQQETVGPRITSSNQGSRTILFG